MKYLKLGLGAIVLTLVLMELVLRGVIYWTPKIYPGSLMKDTVQRQAMKDFVQGNIDRLWAREISEKSTFYEPPFEVYVNRGFDDPNRMKSIAERSKLPPGTSATQQNFLRLNKTPEAGLYTVQTNSLGFRGAEKNAAKDPGVYRIVLLGSYPAFGHAVNDDETYAYQLEKILNSQSSKKFRFEVWNGGRQGGTSIMGAARLKPEVLALKPDLVIWDYGWIEMFLLSDIPDASVQTEKIRMIPMSNAIRPVYQACHDMQYLALCRQIITKYKKVGKKEAIQGWKDGMDFLKKWSVENQVPVIFLRHEGVALPESEYVQYDSPKEKFYFYSTQSTLEAPVTENEKKEFWSKDNWLSELGHKENEEAVNSPELMFHSDAIQYNSIAYRRFAMGLADFMKKYRTELNLPVK